MRDFQSASFEEKLEYLKCIRNLNPGDIVEYFTDLDTYPEYKITNTKLTALVLAKSLTYFTNWGEKFSTEPTIILSVHKASFQSHKGFYKVYEWYPFTKRICNDAKIPDTTRIFILRSSMLISKIIKAR